MYLAAAGIGKLVLSDYDIVETSNLQRQIIHRNDSVGSPKAESARRTLAAINPEVTVNALVERVAGTRLAQLVLESDIVLDCSDNFTTRHAINRACIAHRKPLLTFCDWWTTAFTTASFSIGSSPTSWRRG